MSLNFGQHIKSRNNSLYIEEIVPKTDITNELIKDNNVYTYIFNTSLSNGTFDVNFYVNPIFDAPLTLKIYLQNDNEKVLIKTTSIKEGFRYMSLLKTYYLKVVQINEEYQAAKETLMAAEQDVEDKTILKNQAEINLNNATTAAARRDCIIALEEAKRLLSDFTIARNVDRIIFEQKAQEKLVAEQIFNDAKQNIWIPVSKAVYLTSKIYDKIILEITISLDTQIKYPTNIGTKFQLKRVKEILGNNEIIPQSSLKKIAIQASTGTKFFINNSELEMCSNNIMEIEDSDFPINSFKIIPNNNFFIIDYQY